MSTLTSRNLRLRLTISLPERLRFACTALLEQLHEHFVRAQLFPSLGFVRCSFLCHVNAQRPQLHNLLSVSSIPLGASGAPITSANSFRNTSASAAVICPSPRASKMSVLAATTACLLSIGSILNEMG